MSRYVLVPATGADTDESVFATALTVARLLPAHLEFLHVRLDVQETLSAMASADTGGGISFGQLLETMAQEAASRQKKAELAFRDFCERERLLVSAEPSAALPSAEWRMETGDEPAWLAAHGRAADLVVVGRAHDGEAVDMSLLETALMATGRPDADCAGEGAERAVRHCRDRVEGQARGRPGGRSRSAISSDGQPGGHTLGHRGRARRRTVVRTAPPRPVLAKPQDPRAKPEARRTSGGGDAACRCRSIECRPAGHGGLRPQPGARSDVRRLYPSRPVACRHAGADGALIRVRTAQARLGMRPRGTAWLAHRNLLLFVCVLIEINASGRRRAMMGAS